MTCSIYVPNGGRFRKNYTANQDITTFIPDSKRMKPGKDDLLDVVLWDTLHQRLYLKVAGADAVHRRDETAKDMIETVELLGPLNHEFNELHELHEWANPCFAW